MTKIKFNGCSKMGMYFLKITYKRINQASETKTDVGSNSQKMVTHFTINDPHHSISQNCVTAFI